MPVAESNMLSFNDVWQEVEVDIEEGRLSARQWARGTTGTRQLGTLSRISVDVGKRFSARSEDADAKRNGVDESRLAFTDSAGPAVPPATPSGTVEKRPQAAVEPTPVHAAAPPEAVRGITPSPTSHDRGDRPPDVLGTEQTADSVRSADSHRKHRGRMVGHKDEENPPVTSSPRPSNREDSEYSQDFFEGRSSSQPRGPLGALVNTQPVLNREPSNSRPAAVMPSNEGDQEPVQFEFLGEEDQVMQNSGSGVCGPGIGTGGTVCSSCL
eukprot:gnl/TRDRNA2_/TRDRNA2_140084_c1_seq1.p1 gnl/TRDRNA2_/TRDRNA2_140084_c1~~gnl/TRDRNA2_/TRDRNA2_140084_c1_seq1.p1  ORF type:complete len:312 (-),score=46.70 gnl/TRDRNA2_/TRDRNA2_140084_c1_seq1:72-878(-)